MRKRASKSPVSPRRPAAPSSAPDQGPLLEALAALHAGNFSARLEPGRGVSPEVARAFNALATRTGKYCTELSRISARVGKAGALAERAKLPGAPGDWSSCVGAVNALVDDLVQPITTTAQVIEAVSRGDLTRRMPMRVGARTLQGEFAQTAQSVNRMVQQLGLFASEVTRVAREVGTEGKLGGQARAKGVAGTWKDLTDNVNSMAGNLTAQVRNIADVTTAVANGDLSKKITVDVLSLIHI